MTNPRNNYISVVETVGNIRKIAFTTYILCFTVYSVLDWTTDMYTRTNGNETFS